MNLRSWLRREPQPDSILADDQRIEIPDSPRKWAELTETITALAPQKIVALGPKGQTLRAFILDENAVLDDAEKPGKPTALQSDLVAVAKLLADAHRAGADTMRSAMEEHTKLVRLLADRLGAIEVAWQKSLRSHAQLIMDVAQARAENAGEDAILSSLIPAVMNMADAKPNGAKQ
jgi:hypothetical protein